MGDSYHYHEGIGNQMLLKYLNVANAPDWSNRIMVFSFNPNEEVRALLIDKRVVGVVVAKEEDELLDNLVVELNRLKQFEQPNDIELLE